MAITLHSTGTNSNKTAGLAATAAAFSVTAGDLIIAVLATKGASIAAFLNFSDTVGTSYTNIINSLNGSTVGVYLTYGIAPSTNAVNVVAANWSGGGTSEIWAIFAASFTGWTGTPTVDLTAQTGSGSGTATSIISAAHPTQADGLWLLGAAWNAPSTDTYSVTSSGAGSNFNNAGTGTSGSGATSNIEVQACYYPSPGSVSSMTLESTDSTSRTWAAAGLTFYDLPNPAGLVVPKTTLWAPQRAAIW